MLPNRETLEDCIARITPEDYKGDWSKYKDACKAAAGHARSLLSALDQKEISSTHERQRQALETLRLSLPIRNEWVG